jgi:hypothetical protein
LSGPVRGFDLDGELARLREEKEWQEGRRNAITLHKGGLERGVAGDEGWR